VYVRRLYSVSFFLCFATACEAFVLSFGLFPGKLFLIKFRQFQKKKKLLF